MHVQDDVDPLLTGPAHHLCHPLKVGGAVVAGLGFELTPVEHQADHVEAEGPQLGEVVSTARRRGLMVGRQIRLYLAQRWLRDKRRSRRALAVVGTRTSPERSRATVRIRIGHVLHPDDGRTMQEHLPSCRIGQIRGGVRCAAGRGDDMQVGERRKLGPLAEEVEGLLLHAAAMSAMQTSRSTARGLFNGVGTREAGPVERSASVHYAVKPILRHWAPRPMTLRNWQERC